ncbi:MAG: DUF488 domain-containing protein [Bacteroidota bacterium]|jgi:uncharacterized protein YeaO (DUF488 family)|nr:DUF488 domain-containing protein [Ignavibacteria bacterium]MCU7500119.1 DUF488 domain-containing protein [Ignavibacteria bacterium]MCU7513258.1 DUF488 domain-containing protein [Ignavibacteria bacterium]MCU7519427.1 DUF488 domain-containing protein [Ignavibacteria bacterium]MCU7524945.1 DUF488 domain-containing protein [Ignavibacteria bacterium]
MVKLKRIYEEYDEEDGFRILVDRLWPRGIKKEGSHVDLWLKELGPSSELRKWFNHDPAKWQEFKKKYRSELSGKKDLLSEIRNAEKENKTVTLLYGAKDTEHNQAVVIAGML